MVDIRHSQEELRKYRSGSTGTFPLSWDHRSTSLWYQDISDDQVKAAAEFVDADASFGDLPLGYDAPVSDGSSFSTHTVSLLLNCCQSTRKFTRRRTAIIDSETEALVQNS